MEAIATRTRFRFEAVAIALPGGLGAGGGPEFHPALGESVWSSLSSTEQTRLQAWRELCLRNSFPCLFYRLCEVSLLRSRFGSSAVT